MFVLIATSFEFSSSLTDQQFNCVKEMLLPEIAEFFQNAGVTALIYDPRSIGLSDGLPRNEIDPTKQVEDYSDALTFLTTLPIVETSQLGCWGMSLSGVVALCAAALDRRVKFLITVCPGWKCWTEGKRDTLLAKAAKDRVSQAKGNPAFSVVPFSPSGYEASGLDFGIGQEGHELMKNEWERRVPTFRNRVTVQSFYKIAMWQPQGLMRYVSPTPVMMLIPEYDYISKPEDQRALFEGIQGPKRLHIADGKGHLNVLVGDKVDVVMQQQIDFIKDVLDGKLRQ